MDYPWRPHYIDDFREATQDFTLEEEGAYHRLLDHQWMRGYVPADPRRRARILGVTLRKLDVLWKVLGPKFPASPRDPERLVNPRGDAEKHGAITRTKAGQAGAAGRWGKGSGVDADGDAGQGAQLNAEVDALTDATSMRSHHTDHSNTDTYGEKNARARIGNAMTPEARITPALVSEAWLSIGDGVMAPSGITDLAEKLDAIARSPVSFEPILRGPFGVKQATDLPAAACRAFKRIIAGSDPGFEPRWTPFKLVECLGDVQAVLRGDKNPEANRAARQGVKAAARPVSKAIHVPDHTRVKPGVQR